MSAQTIDFQADPRAHRESGFVPQYTPPEAAAARAATNRESFLPWTTPATSLRATSPRSSLRSPTRAYSPLSTTSAETPLTFSLMETFRAQRDHGALAHLPSATSHSKRRSAPAWTQTRRPTANCTPPSSPIRSLPKRNCHPWPAIPIPPARFARPRGPTLPHRLHRRKHH